VAATIFNATLKENEAWFAAVARNLSLRSTGTFGSLAALRPLGSAATRLGSLTPLLLLALTALIYGALDPHFGLNDSTLVLVLALMGGLTLTTFLYEGGQVLFSQRAFGTPAVIRAYPVAIVIAATSVGLSRIIDLNPGVIFGFVAAAALASGGIGRREQGIIVFVPMVALLGVSLLALSLIGPLRSFADGKSGVWATLPETIAVAVFVGGAQSVLLSLIPLTFNDGQKVWRWNRPAWIALALPATFLLFHVIVNRDGQFGGIEGASALLPLIAAAVFLAIAALTWLAFRLRVHPLPD
jgi:hypothetical protein